MQRTVLAFTNLGDQLMCFLRFAFRADGFWLFAEAQRDDFKLFFAFIAFKFIYGHDSIFLIFFFFNPA